METYKTLQIFDTSYNLDLIGKNLISWNKNFVFQKRNSREYAENVFVGVNEAFCLKTNRKLLYESTVWLVRYGNCIKVTNITANIPLDADKYNYIIVQFARDVIEKVVFDSTSVQLSSQGFSFEDIMSNKTYKSFCSWFETCNPEAPIEHPIDLNRFLNFIRNVYDNDDHLFDINLFGDLFKEARPFVSDEKIIEIENKIQFGIEVCKFLNEDK